VARAPAAYVGSACGEVLAMGCNRHAQTRRWTLGPATDMAVRTGWAGWRAATLAHLERGLLVLSREPALLAAFALSCAVRHGLELENATWSWLTGWKDGGPVQAHRAEKGFYVPADTVARAPWLGRRLATAPAEGLVEELRACANERCRALVEQGAADCPCETGEGPCPHESPDAGLLVGERLVPAARAAHRPLRLTHALVLDEDPEARAPHLVGLQVREALPMVAVGSPVSPWCGVHVAEATRRLQAEALRRCFEATRLQALRFAPQALAQACAAVAGALAADSPRRSA
jgi:hypothetical protein